MRLCPLRWLHRRRIRRAEAEAAGRRRDAREADAARRRALDMARNHHYWATEPTQQNGFFTHGQQTAYQRPDCQR